MSKLRKYLTILALSFAGGSIYTLPYLKYIFYDPQMEVMGITNTQSGLLISMYAIGCMISYIPGGILADKFSPRKAIFASTTLTALLGCWYAFTFNYNLSLVMWIVMAFTSAFVFWSALLKAVSLTGGSEEQGFLYGLYYAGNGISGAIMNAIALYGYGLGATPTEGLSYAVLILCVGIALSGIFVYILVPEGKVATAEEDKFNFTYARQLLVNPMLWVFSFIVFAGYAVFSNLPYLTPYLTNVIGVSLEESAGFTLIRNYVFYLLSPLGGLLADKIFKSTSKLFVVLFILIAASFFSVIYLPKGMDATLVGIYSLLPGAFGLMLYGIVFSVVREINIKPMVLGTAIAIASVLGYSTDFFMPTLFGHLLDTYGNEAGYRMIFNILGTLCLMGSVVAGIIYMNFKRNNKIAA